MLNLEYKLILASQSPRRQQLLTELGLEFEVRLKNVAEEYPSSLKAGQIALYLAELKASAFAKEISGNELIITADTIVWLEDQSLAKPADEKDAERMLTLLSGKMHEVFTGVSLTSVKKKRSFFVRTEVYFRKLTLEEIRYYIARCKPFDKAGSYGAQDWLGLVGIEKINGSYFNVMGLPVKELYEELLTF